MASSFNGVVLLDKTEGVSSFGALGSLKKHYDTRRVGHTGTLDPMATGLMAALIGPATRCARYFSSLDKTYEATVTFGTETDTDDRTGNPVRTADWPAMDEVAGALEQFMGTIRQTPPAYSAIHINGKRAYDLARSGREVDIPSREVTIHSILVTECNPDHLTLTIRCSSGTYIRSLARDLGRVVNSAAHLSALRRTRVGPFSVDECADTTAGRMSEIGIAEALLRLSGFSELPAGQALANRMWNGGKVTESELESLLANDTDKAPRLIATFEGEPVAIGIVSEGRFVYDLVFPCGSGND